MFLNLWDFRKTKNKFVENILYFLPDKCRKKEIREYESFYIKSIHNKKPQKKWLEIIQKN